MKKYKSGYLKVSEIHEIYYECKGNKEGIPILFLHGGPGSGCKEKNEVFFDEYKHNVIFLDQRGAGKSKVIGGDVLKENKTNLLLEDIIKLLEFLEIEKVNIFGRSWGSTLALVFSIKYPDKVFSIVTGGIYLGGIKPIKEFLYGNGNEQYFPDVWYTFLDKMPEKIKNDRGKLFKYIYEEMFNGNYIPLKYLTDCESQMLKLDRREKSEEGHSEYTKRDINGAKIEFYYIYNACFFEKDYILDNCNKLDNIHISIIQGRYDSVCPSKDAYFLNKKLKNSKLIFTLAGHSSSDKENVEASIQEINKIFKK